MVNELLCYVGYLVDVKVKIDYFNVENIIEDNVVEILKDYDGILVLGGFGSCGIEGMIIVIKYVCE